MRNPIFTVCGSGRAGAAIAADIALMGFDVNLFELDRFSESIQPIVEKGGIELTGKTQSGRTGFANLSKITTDPEDAVENADLIMITAPAFGHEAFFEELSPHLSEGQCIMINTGYWGSLRFANLPGKQKILHEITLAEANIMPYLSDKEGHKVHIYNVKQDIKLATFPGRENSKVFDILKLVYPQHRKVPNVLWTNLSAGNPSVHATFLLPIAGLPFDRFRGCKLYGETTVCGERLVTAFDRERTRIAQAFGCSVDTTFAWFQKTYGYVGRNLNEALRKSAHADRYIPAERLQGVVTEDISYFYVPTSRIAHSLGIHTPIMNGLISIMGAMLETDYWEMGVTLEELGFAGLSVEEIVKYVNTGEKEVTTS